jgi:hypothetical protein
MINDRMAITSKVDLITAWVCGGQYLGLVGEKKHRKFGGRFPLFSPLAPNRSQQSSYG